MKPAPRSDAQLLAWAAALITKQQTEKAYGSLTLHFESGRIIRAKTERTEMPDTTLAIVAVDKTAAGE
jgi:hypothetical protein